MSQAVTRNVKELVYVFGSSPKREIPYITAAFPKLVSLKASFSVGYRHLRWELLKVSHITPCLLSLSPTLEELCLRTSWEYPWAPSGQQTPVLMGLSGMVNLKRLTTEAIWLFGSQDPVSSIAWGRQLPQSLVRLSVEDFWGLREKPPSEGFFPNFGQGWELPTFWDEAFSQLYDLVVTKRLPCLEEIVFVPHWLHQPDVAIDGYSHPKGFQYSFENDCRKLVSKYEDSFGSAGIRFSVVALEEAETQFRSCWTTFGQES